MFGFMNGAEGRVERLYEVDGIEYRLNKPMQGKE